MIELLPWLDIDVSNVVYRCPWLRMTRCSPISCTKCLYWTLLFAFGCCCPSAAVATRCKSKPLFVTNIEHVVFGNGCFDAFNYRPSVAVASLQPACQTVVLYRVIQVLLHRAWWSWWYTVKHAWLSLSPSCFGSVWIYCSHISTFGQVLFAPASLMLLL